MKKALAFDLDKTLNDPKLPIGAEMAGIFAELLGYYPMCVISGQKFEQFELQVVQPLLVAGATEQQLANLHLMVGQGTQYYVRKNAAWERVYNNALTTEQVAELSEALEQAARELDYWVELTNGDEIIENRESMVAYSALGQKAALADKLAWDPDMSKRNKIVKRVLELVPNYEFEVGGTTTINAFVPGMNKVYGMTKWMEIMGFTTADILYFGDMTQPGGNDYPVVEMGIQTITVEKWQDTAFCLRGILGMAQ
ncbi:MAG: HAD-IIB family hydrolase [Candidatus Nomurabacteria bacterium]|jgi:HAD superfamily hydrolase (TIGR01484 family)|nr:HAD-IIB family hydrolase [Candidatus Nomurabacteria bacterium]